MWFRQSTHQEPSSTPRARPYRNGTEGTFLSSQRTPRGRRPHTATCRRRLCPPPPGARPAGCPRRPPRGRQPRSLRGGRSLQASSRRLRRPRDGQCERAGCPAGAAGSGAASRRTWAGSSGSAWWARCCGAGTRQRPRCCSPAASAPPPPPPAAAAAAAVPPPWCPRQRPWSAARAAPLAAAPVPAGVAALRPGGSAVEPVRDELTRPRGAAEELGLVPRKAPGEGGGGVGQPNGGRAPRHREGLPALPGLRGRPGGKAQRQKWGLQQAWRSMRFHEAFFNYYFIWRAHLMPAAGVAKLSGVRRCLEWDGAALVQSSSVVRINKIFCDLLVFTALLFSIDSTQFFFFSFGVCPYVLLTRQHAGAASKQSSLSSHELFYS